MVSTDGFYNSFNLCGAGLLAGIFIAAGVAHTHSAVAEFHVAAHALACRCVYLCRSCRLQYFGGIAAVHSATRHNDYAPGSLFCKLFK